MAPLSRTALGDMDALVDGLGADMVMVRWGGGGVCRGMIVGIVGRGIGCGAVGGMALVCGCTGCSGGEGSVHIGGQRAIGCSCLWLLSVSSAFGRCCCGTTVGRARLGSCCVCLDCCRNGLLCEVHALIYHRVRDSVRTGGDRWLGRGLPCQVCW